MNSRRGLFGVFVGAAAAAFVKAHEVEVWQGT